MHQPVDKRSFDYRVCRISDILRLLTIYRLIFLRRKIYVGELPGFKSTIKFLILHHLWPLQRGILSYRKIKARLLR